MKTKRVTCHWCGMPFQKSLKEVNRLKNKGSKHFCCREHGMAYCRKFNQHKGDASHLDPANQWRPESPFKWYIKICNLRRSRPRQCTIDAAYLKRLWARQKGMCPYTGLAMQLPKSTKGFMGKGTPTSASLDRIDAAKDYVKGNVEFVCRFINMGKQQFGRQTVIDFVASLKAVP